MYYLYYCNTEKSQSWPVAYDEYLPHRICNLNWVLLDKKQSSSMSTEVPLG